MFSTNVVVPTENYSRSSVAVVASGPTRLISDWWPKINPNGDRILKTIRIQAGIEFYTRIVNWVPALKHIHTTYPCKNKTTTD